MSEYIIKDYQKGFEEDQVKIGFEAARDWVWPYAYNLEDLLKIHKRADFDPETRHYCFLDNKMVGFIVCTITSSKNNKVQSADFNFPRVIKGHEQVAVRLIEKALEILRNKGVSRVVGRVTTMCPRDIQLAKDMGFTISNWGYKVYYSYQMNWGRLDDSNNLAEEINPKKDLIKCAELAANWYNRSPEWCYSLLKEWHKAGIITHSGVRENGKLIASCMAAPNDVRPTTAAMYYIYVTDEQNLKPLLANVVNKCIDYGIVNVIADLLNEHRQYEPVYKRLGFKKVAEWARCEKVLD